MSYYEDEIPKELTLDGKYTSRQIYLFMIENKDVIILSDSVHLSFSSNDIEYMVKAKKENFIHKLADNSYKTHMIPNRKTRIYEISRIL